MAKDAAHTIEGPPHVLWSVIRSLVCYQQLREARAGPGLGPGQLPPAPFRVLGPGREEGRGKPHVEMFREEAKYSQSWGAGERGLRPEPCWLPQEPREWPAAGGGLPWPSGVCPGRQGPVLPPGCGRERELEGAAAESPGSAVRPSGLNVRADGATPASAAPLCGQWGHSRKRRGPAAVQGQREGALGAKAAWSGERGIKG